MEGLKYLMIHKYKLAGYNIVLDVNSGGVHVVDDLTYDLLDNVEPPFADKCPENVIEKLLKFYEKDDCDKTVIVVKSNETYNLDVSMYKKAVFEYVIKDNIVIGENTKLPKIYF